MYLVYFVQLSDNSINLGSVKYLHPFRLACPNSFRHNIHVIFCTYFLYENCEVCVTKFSMTPTVLFIIYCILNKFVIMIICTQHPPISYKTNYFHNNYLLTGKKVELFSRDKPEILYCASEARTKVRGFAEGKSTFFTS